MKVKKSESRPNGGGLIAKNCADGVDCLFLAQGAMGRKNPCFSAVENSQKNT